MQTKRLKTHKTNVTLTKHKFKNRSYRGYLCAYRCAQLSYTTQHAAVLTIFSLTSKRGAEWLACWTRAQKDFHCVLLYFFYLFCLSVCLSVCLCVFVYGPRCLIQIKGRRAWVQIAAATLSGNSPRQTVHTHRASVHQAAKLVAALSMVMAANRRVYDSRHLQADCQEPRSAPEHYARQSSVGYLF